MARPKSGQAHRRVLEAAAELFGNRGIDATSMDALSGEIAPDRSGLLHQPDGGNPCCSCIEA